MLKKILIGMIFFLILIVGYVSINPPIITVSSHHTSNPRKILYLNAGDSIIEHFNAKTNRLNSIGILLYVDRSIYEECLLSVEIQDGNEGFIAKKEIRKSDIISEYYNYLNFDYVKDSLNQQFTLIVKNDCNNSIGLGFYDSDDQTSITYNNNEFKKGIFFIELGCKNFYSYIEYIAVVILILIIMIVMIDEKGEIDDKKNQRK